VPVMSAARIRTGAGFAPAGVLVMVIHSPSKWIVPSTPFTSMSAPLCGVMGGAMAARFKVKRKGIGEMLRMPGMEEEMLRPAVVSKGVASGLSPVAPNRPLTGNNKASWETSSKRRGGRKRDRAVGYVRNKAYYARWVEYGTEQVHAHHVLLRAAQIGGRD